MIVRNDAEDVDNRGEYVVSKEFGEALTEYKEDFKKYPKRCNTNIYSYCDFLSEKTHKDYDPTIMD